MMSASAISAKIRAKKKAMEEEHSDAVKLSGIPEDATDIMVNKNKEPGEMLSENTPMDRNESPTLEELESQQTEAQPHIDEAVDPKQVNQPADGERENRKAKIKKTLSKMGK